MSQKKTRTMKKKVDRANERAEAFVAQLARDLFVARHNGGWVSDNVEKTAHQCMTYAVSYFQALATFRGVVPPPAQTPAELALARELVQQETPSYQVPPQTVGEILDEAEAAGALPKAPAEEA